MNPIKLTAITEPKFPIETPDGATRELDPWKLTAAFAKIDSDETLGMDEGFELTRKAFGFPTLAEVEASEQDPKPFTLTRHQCVHLKLAVGEFIEGLSESKKMSAMRQRFSALAQA